MDPLQRTIMVPGIEIIGKRATRRQIFRDRAPLASGGEDGHHPVEHFANVDRAFIAAAPAGAYRRPRPIRRRSGRWGNAACPGYIGSDFRSSK